MTRETHPLSNLRVGRTHSMPSPWSQPVETPAGWSSTDGVGTLTASHPEAIYDAARVMASDPGWAKRWPFEDAA